MFEKSILIVAHPDDEALWFSSIMDNVNQIVVCYLDVKSNPTWSSGRRNSLLEYPLRNIHNLELDESEVFEGPNWKLPIITEYGLEISRKGLSDNLYKRNYKILKHKLEHKLKDCHNVFTHNPWGEYGHVEHVQVYRVVKELQKRFNFNLWFSNYCSNKSFNFMLNYISTFNSEYWTLKTNKHLGHQIKELYQKNNCWTWYDNYEWFNEESFMQDTLLKVDNNIPGHIFPINLIKIEIHDKKRKLPYHRKILRKISRKVRRL